MFSKRNLAALLMTAAASAFLPASASAQSMQPVVAKVENPYKQIGVYAVKGDYESARKLIASGVDINGPDSVPKKPGDKTFKKHAALTFSIESKNAPAMEFLFQSGTKISGYTGTILLLSSASAQFPEGVKILLKNNAANNTDDLEELIASLKETSKTEVDKQIIKMLQDHYVKMTAGVSGMAPKPS